MKIKFLVLIAFLGGCASGGAYFDQRIEAHLAAGNYHHAIRMLEAHQDSAGRIFALGLLYAYRELDTRGSQADFTRAIERISSAAPWNEEARRLMEDYRVHGDRVFIALPWTHIIGPFPPLTKPEKEPNQRLQTTRFKLPMNSIAQGPACLTRSVRQKKDEARISH